MRIDRRRASRVAIRGALALLFLAVVGGWWFYRHLVPDICGERHQFSAKTWAELANAKLQTPDRACVVDNLLSSGILRGRARAELDSLLGPPTTGGPFSTAGQRTYYLGPERGPFGIDSQWLVIEIDSLGRVTRARVMTD
jgi:hypothetical protein